MAIRPFIRLSTEFASGAENDRPNPFLSKRIIREYFQLDIDDRLRIHGIIDRKNYIASPPEVFRAVAPADMAHALDTLYTIIVQGNREDILLYLNGNHTSDEEPYEKVKLYGCIPVYIAIDLAHALESRVITPYQAKIGPV